MRVSIYSTVLFISLLLVACGPKPITTSFTELPERQANVEDMSVLKSYEHNDYYVYMADANQLFDDETATLRPGSKAALEEMARIIKASALQNVTIQTYSENAGLAKDRNKTVEAWLEQYANIPTDDITFFGMNKTNNCTEDCKTRTEIWVAK